MAGDLVQRPDWLPALSAAETTIGREYGHDGPLDVVRRAVAVPETLNTDLAREWAKGGGVSIRLGQAQAGALAALDYLDEDLQAEVLASVDGLPALVQTAIFRELSLGSTGSIRSAGDADMAKFATSPEGQELVAAWGHRAPRHVAIVKQRLGRVLAALDDGGQAAFWTWFRDLDSAAAVAILREIGK